MKIFLPCLLFLFFLEPSAKATNVVIIESKSNEPGQVMDSLWNSLCHSIGYSSAIYPQTKLDSSNWFCSTDVLIVSSGIIDLPPNRISTIQTYLDHGGRVYLQSEYLASDEPNIAFAQIVNALGGDFTWLGDIQSVLDSVDVSGVISDTPYIVTSIDYFNSGCYGDGIGTNSHITPFLEWDGLYFGFIFNVPSSCGIMICQSDEDWIVEGKSPALMTNMLVYLANRTGACQVNLFNLDLGNDTSMCMGDTINLNAPNGAISYLWSNGDTTRSIHATTPGAYWAQISNSACLLSDTITISQARTSFQYLLSDTEICGGSSTTVSITGAGALGLYPASGTSWQDSLLVTLQPDTTTLYTLTGQTTCGNNDTANFMLRIDPPVTINLVTDSSSICRGDTAYILASGNFTSSLWGTGDSLAWIQALIPGVYSIYASRGACTATDSIRIEQKITSFQYLLSDSQLCPGAVATLTITGALNPALYPDQNVSWSDSAQASIQPDSTNTYWLIAQTTCGNIDTARVMLSVWALPVVNITPDSASVCPGDSVHLCSAANFASYSWSSGDTTACIYAQPDDYSLTVTDSHRCTAVSGPATVSAYGAPSVSISVDSAKLSTFGYDNYQWYRNDTLISGANGPVYLANISGSYTVAIVDSEGCSATSSPVDISTGILDLAPYRIDVYPNPSVANWQLTVDGSLFGSALEVFDAGGQLVLQSGIRNANSEIPAGGLPAGVYYLHISSATGSLIRKLIKM